MKWLTVLDNFSKIPSAPIGQKPHGVLVELAAKSTGLSSEVGRLNVESNRLTRKEIADFLERVRVETESVVVNFSFGGGASKTLGEGMTWANFDRTINGPDLRIYSAMKSLFDEGTTLVLPSGNEPDHRTSPDFSVSFLTTSAYSINVGAGYIDAKTGLPVFESYGKIHPGFIDFMSSGQIENAIGTSFAAPRVAAVVAQLQEHYEGELSHAEVRSALELLSTVQVYQKGQETTGIRVDHPELLEGFQYYRFLDPEQALMRLEQQQWKPGQLNTELKVNAFYEFYLGRNPDDGGQEYWSGVYEREGALALANGFKNSEEFQSREELSFDRVPLAQRIQSAFHVLLDREPEDEGLSYWINRVVEEHTEERVFNEVFIPSGIAIDFEGFVEDFVAVAGQRGETIDQGYLWG